MFHGTFRDKTVLVTGHTGFKGGWLCVWLRRLGARVIGYALDPGPGPGLFTRGGLADQVIHREGDVRDTAGLAGILRRYRPEFVFHLAAQALVRESYRSPRETFDVNVMGTVSVLEAVR